MCRLIFASSTYDAGPTIAAISENGLRRNAINGHFINENKFSSIRAFAVGTYDNNLDLFLSGPTSRHTSKSGHCVIHCIY